MKNYSFKATDETSVALSYYNIGIENLALLSTDALIDGHRIICHHAIGSFSSRLVLGEDVLKY